MIDYVHRLTVRALHADDVEAACRCLREGRYTQGETVRAFERALEAWTGVKHLVACNSGSSALLLAAHWLCGRGQTDRNEGEVLVPALCWSTTAWPFYQMGMDPVLVDVDPQTLGIDLASATAALSSRTRALVVVHPLGSALDMEPIERFCRRHDLALVEDCCESIGAHWRGDHVGSSGVVSAFSFYHSHVLSTIEGGAVACMNEEMADEVRSARAHGWARDAMSRTVEPTDPLGFDFVRDGFNLRMTQPQAAIGISQLVRLDETIKRRRAVAAAVATELASVPWIHLPLRPKRDDKAPSRRSVEQAWMFVPFVLDEGAPMDAARTRAILERHGIETRPVIAGNLGRHPAAMGRLIVDRVPLTVADAIWSRGIMVGCPPDATDEGMTAMARACEEMRTS